MLAKQSARAFQNPVGKSPCRGAFIAGRSTPPGGVFSTNKILGESRRPNQFRLFSSSSVDIEDDLNVKIKAKGDEIRQLKADGVDKATLAPHVQELQALKAQLPPSAETEQAAPAAKKQQATKPEKQKKANTQPNIKKGVEEMSESELRLNRLAKIEAMKEANVEPFEYTFQCNRSAAKLAAEYEGRLVEGEEDKESDVAVAGRIMTRRVFGKLAFITLQDETGIIQLQFDAERLGDSFKVRHQYYRIVMEHLVGSCGPSLVLVNGRRRSQKHFG